MLSEVIILLKLKAKLKPIKLDIGKVEKKIKEDLIVSLKEATPVDTGNARDGWKLENDKIVNDVEYISQLNNGSSEQAPQFFIEKVVLRNPNMKAKGSIVRFR